MKRDKEAIRNWYMSQQDNRCGICGSPPNETRALALDHCHTTDHYRGLLCSRCNIGLGYFRDSDYLLKRAMVYLASAEYRRPPEGYFDDGFVLMTDVYAYQEACESIEDAI